MSDAFLFLLCKDLKELLNSKIFSEYKEAAFPSKDFALLTPRMSSKTSFTWLVTKVSNLSRPLFFLDSSISFLSL